MSENGIYGKQKRKWVATTDSGHDNPVVPNHSDQYYTGNGTFARPFSKDGNPLCHNRCRLNRGVKAKRNYTREV